MGLNAIHGQEQAGSAVAAATIPYAQVTVVGYFMLYIPQPLQEIIPPEMPRRLLTQKLILGLHFGMHFQFLQHQFKELFRLHHIALFR